jgi:lysophospholipase L1-like esterase
VARLLGPDANARFVYTSVGGTLRSAAGLTATVYSTAVGNLLADIATYDGTNTPGATISGSTLTVDSDSFLPRFWFPDTVDTVYVSVNGGTRVALNADYDARLDAIDARWSYSYVGLWAASTGYVLNDLVTAPTGDIVTPKIAFTSSSSYSATNWNIVVPVGAETRHLLRGNRVSWLGDSITIGNSTFTATSTLRGDKDPLNWLHILTDGKAAYQTNAGISGNTTTQMAARTTDVTTPGADWCLVMGGTNDCSSGISLATYAANVRAIVAALIVANIRPVLVTPPPKTITGTNRQTLEKYVAWLRYYAYRTGIPLVDGWSALIDPTTGNMQSAYDSGDGIHPGPAGAKVLGQAVADTLTGMLNPVLAHPPAHQTSDSRNMIAGGLFLVDTNADGVSDSWTKTGSGTASRITGDTVILGTWQRLVDTVNEFTQITSTSVSTGFSVGDRLAFTGLVKSGTTSGQVNVQLVFTNASPSVNVRPVSGLTTTVTAHRFYLEYVVPAGTTAIQVSISSQSGTGMDIQVAQVGVFNLTSLGVDTA